MGRIDLPPGQLRFAIHGANLDLSDPPETEAAMAALNGKAAATLSAGAASAIAWLAWSSNAVLSPLALLFPPLTFGQRTRTHSAGVALVYYGVSSLPVRQISSAYFETGHVWASILPWAIASAILAAPWIILWSRDQNQAWWRVPAALVVVTVPPIGIIGWASPLQSAGVLFPGSNWLGIVLTVAAMVAMSVRSGNTIFAAAVLSLAFNLWYDGLPVPTSDWAGVNTNFGNLHASNDPLVDFTVAERIQKAALGTRARVIVFPELVVRQWGEGTDLLWKPTFDTLQARGTTILIGAGQPSPDSIDEYRNAVVIRGFDDAQTFNQRIPVPLAMWKPWGGKERVAPNLYGPPTVELAGDRAAILICYEQLLPWSYLSALWRKPTMIVGLSNAYWTGATVIPKNQTAALKAWGRLFNIPVISATNY